MQTTKYIKKYIDAKDYRRAIVETFSARSPLQDDDVLYRLVMQNVGEACLYYENPDFTKAVFFITLAVMKHDGDGAWPSPEHVEEK